MIFLLYMKKVNLILRRIVINRACLIFSRFFILLGKIFFQLYKKFLSMRQESHLKMSAQKKKIGFEFRLNDNKVHLSGHFVTCYNFSMNNLYRPSFSTTILMMYKNCSGSFGVAK